MTVFAGTEMVRVTYADPKNRRFSITKQSVGLPVRMPRDYPYFDSSEGAWFALPWFAHYQGVKTIVLPGRNGLEAQYRFAPPRPETSRGFIDSKVGTAFVFFPGYGERVGPPAIEFDKLYPFPHRDPYPHTSQRYQEPEVKGFQVQGYFSPNGSESSALELEWAQLAIQITEDGRLSPGVRSWFGSLRVVLLKDPGIVWHPHIGVLGWAVPTPEVRGGVLFVRMMHPGAEESLFRCPPNLPVGSASNEEISLLVDARDYPNEAPKPYSSANLQLWTNSCLLYPQRRYEEPPWSGIQFAPPRPLTPRDPSASWRRHFSGAETAPVQVLITLMLGAIAFLGLCRWRRNAPHNNGARRVGRRHLAPAAIGMNPAQRESLSQLIDQLGTKLKQCDLKNLKQDSRTYKSYDRCQAALAAANAVAHLNNHGAVASTPICDFINDLKECLKLQLSGKSRSLSPPTGPAAGPELHGFFQAQQLPQKRRS